jgi:hypothetical protein
MQSYLPKVENKGKKMSNGGYWTRDSLLSVNHQANRESEGRKEKMKGIWCHLEGEGVIRLLTKKSLKIIGENGKTKGKENRTFTNFLLLWTRGLKNKISSISFNPTLLLVKLILCITRAGSSNEIVEMISSWVDTIAIVKENEGCGGIYSLPTKTSHYVATVIRTSMSPKTNRYAPTVIRSRLSPTTSRYDVMVIKVKLSPKTSHYTPTIIRARLSLRTSHYPEMVIRDKLSNNMPHTSFLGNDHMKRIFKMFICKIYTI